VAFLVAHRAGNDLARLRAAESAGVPLVEADVHLWNGRLEVRHLKTVGPLPLFWDRWELASPFRRRLTLPELLAATGHSTELMLDLKGFDTRLATRVAALLPLDRRVTVCSRTWRLLDPFLDLANVRTIHSVGSERQLRALLRRFDGRVLDGVAIHERLLDADTVTALRRHARTLLTWPVNGAERALALLELGVDGLITDDVDAVTAAVA
jgi:glycerophosphoryl diester phosphodiesterase